MGRQPPPHRSTFPLSQEIPDIFIPPTPMGNAGVMRARNENSGMTTKGAGIVSQARRLGTTKNCFNFFPESSIMLQWAPFPKKHKEKNNGIR